MSHLSDAGKPVRTEALLLCWLLCLTTPRPCPSLSPAPSAANNTFWNIWAGSSGQLPLPPCDFGPSLTFVGAYGPPEDGSSSSDSGDRRRLLAAVGGVASAAARPAWCAAQGWWVEAAQRGSKVQPVDLHAAMVQRRLGGR